MRSEMRSVRLILGLISAWIIIFISVLFVFNLRSGTMRLEAEAILVLTLIVAAAFAYVGTGEIVIGASFGPHHRREFFAYIILGVVSLVSGIALAVSGEESLKSIAILVSPYALLFGLAEIRLVHGLQHHARQARSLSVCGAVEIFCGILLATGYLLSEQAIIATLGFTAVASLLQLTPFLLFRPGHHFPHST